MAGDWVKIRVGIASDPKVMTIADQLSRKRAFMDWLTGSGPCHCTHNAYEYVNLFVLVSIVVRGLVQVWGAAREHGVRANDLTPVRGQPRKCPPNVQDTLAQNSAEGDLVLEKTDLKTVDALAGFP